MSTEQTWTVSSGSLSSFLTLFFPSLFRLGAFIVSLKDPCLKRTGSRDEYFYWRPVKLNRYTVCMYSLGLKIFCLPCLWELRRIKKFLLGARKILPCSKDGFESRNIIWFRLFFSLQVDFFHGRLWEQFLEHMVLGTIFSVCCDSFWKDFNN